MNRPVVLQTDEDTSNMPFLVLLSSKQGIGLMGGFGKLMEGMSFIASKGKGSPERYSTGLKPVGN